MLRTIILSLLTVLFGATAVAHAACGTSCCTQATASCTAGAPAAPADEHSNMQMPMTKASQSTRSYSYQPSNGYRSASPGRSQGLNVRGAASKALGNY